MKFYHGTTAEAVVDILSNRRLLISNNSWDWLGPGVYFYQDAPIKALAWAHHYAVKEEKKGSEAVVLEAEISLDSCFDLLKNDLLELARVNYMTLPYEENREFQNRPVLRDANETAYRLFSGEPMKETRVRTSGFNFVDNENIRTLLWEYIEDNDHPGYNCVRAPFWEGAELFKGSFFFDHSNIQLCVLAQSDEVSGEDGKRPFLDFGRIPFTSEPRIFRFTRTNDELMKDYIRWPR